MTMALLRCIKVKKYLIGIILCWICGDSFSQSDAFDKNELVWRTKLEAHNAEITEAKNNSDTSALIEAYIKKATFYNDRNSIYSDYNKAISIFKKGLKIVRSQDALAKARCYEGMGDAGRFLQNVIIASENYTKAEKIYKKLNNDNRRAICFHRIGDLLLDQKNYDLSKSNYEQAIELYRKAKN